MTVMEFSREKELLYAGHEAGREEGLIAGTVQTLAAFVSKEEASMRIQESYGLSSNEAQNYVNRYYKGSEKNV